MGTFLVLEKFGEKMVVIVDAMCALDIHAGTIPDPSGERCLIGEPVFGGA